MVHLITYDLNGYEPSASYEAIKRLIIENASECRHVLRSGWLVHTDSPPKEWFRVLRQVLDSNDRFFITQVHSTDSGFTEPEVHDWLVGKV